MNNFSKINDSDGKTVVPVVFSADHNFIMPTSVAILSMLQNSTDCFCRIIILQGKDVTGKDQESLKTLIAPFAASIEFQTMGNEFDNCFEIRGISTASYYRIQIPWLIPDLDKVLYIDGDVLFKQSILQLFNEDIEGYYVGGVNNIILLDISIEKYVSQIGADHNSYINGGVQIINSKLQRTDNLYEQYKKHLGEKYKYQDQDIVNIVCKGKVKLISHKYNSTYTAIKYYQANNGKCKIDKSQEYSKLQPLEPVIIHYAGAKPWNSFTLYWRDWWNVFEETEFYSKDLEYKISYKIWNPHFTKRQLLRLFVKQHAKLLSMVINKIKS